MKKELKIRLRNILIYSLPLGGGLGWGCSSALDDTVAEQPRPCTAVSINAGISGDVEAETRAVLTGTSFPQNSTIGIFVSKHGTNEAFSLNMHNIRGTQTESNTQVWKFNYENNTDTQFPYIYIIGDRKNLVNADIYAYAPWVKGATNIEKIPFTLDTRVYIMPWTTSNPQTDLMYAVENDPNNTANKNIRPGKFEIIEDVETEVGIDDKTIDLTFKHALSMIRFAMKATNAENVIDASHPGACIGRIRLTPISDRVKLYNTGTFNAITGAVTPTGAAATSINRDPATGEHNRYLRYDYYTNFDMTIIPYTISSTLADDAEVLKAEILDENSTTQYQFNITKGMLKHNDGATYGFQPNCIYTFYFTIENYVHIDQIVVDTEWTEGTAPEKSV